MVERKIEIREVESFDEMDCCLELQREVFSFPDLEVSPRRHLVVTKQSGGFTLGAYDGDLIVGLAITVPAFFGSKRAFYSHMAAVKREYQSHGIGAKLKWAQRARALAENVRYIKWTFQPVQARNAFFNLEKLGAVIKEYVPNFYGTGFSNSGAKAEIESDRVYAEWELESEKVNMIAHGEKFNEKREIIKTIEIMNDWNSLIENDLNAAIKEQNRIRTEFQNALSEGLICAGFDRSGDRPKYLFFNRV
jgi:predicted GNAT superfamily acetyltransferase